MGAVLPAKRDIEHLIDPEFKSLRKYCDEIYGEITVLQDRKTRLHYALIQLPMDEPDRYQRKLEQKLRSTNQNILKLHKYYSVRQDFCSLDKRFLLIVEYHENSLEKEILTRQQQQNYFKKNDLLSIYYQFSRIVLHLQASPNGLIVSNKLVVLTKRFWLKVLEKDLQERKDTSFYELPFSDEPDRKYLYVSPEVMHLLSLGQLIPAQQANIVPSSQAYTLGMCFLEIATLADVWDAYDFENYIIDFEKIQEYLQYAKGIYGRDIHELIENMIKEKPQERTTVEEVYRFLDQSGEFLNSVSPQNKGSFQNGEPGRKPSLHLMTRPVSKQS